MTWLRADNSERDSERRFKILEGCNFDLEKARQLIYWVDTGHVMGEDVPVIRTSGYFPHLDPNKL